MNDLKDRCSHDPKTYRYNCILCVRNDLEDAKYKIKELEEFLHNIAEPCPYCGDKARAMSMVLDDTEQQI